MNVSAKALFVLCSLLLILYNIDFGFACLSSRLNIESKKPYFKPRFSRRGSCVPLEIKSDGALCSNVPYDKTYFPNPFRYKDQQKAHIDVSAFQPLAKLGCSLDLVDFLCGSFFPQCSNRTGHMVLPCRSVCETVRAKCEEIIVRHGFKWPIGFRCDLFPIDGSFECTRTRITTTTTSTTTTATNTSPITSQATTTSAQGYWGGKIEPGSQWESDDDDVFVLRPSNTKSEKDEDCEENGRVPLTKTDKSLSAPSNCTRGHYKCREATVQSYLNGRVFCCFHGKVIAYSVTSGTKGELSSSCLCSYPRPPGDDCIATPDKQPLQ